MIIICKHMVISIVNVGLRTENEVGQHQFPAESKGDEEVEDAKLLKISNRNILIHLDYREEESLAFRIG